MKCMHWMAVAGLVMAALPVAAATPLAQLQQRLQQLTSAAPLHAQVTLHQLERHGGGDHPKTSVARVTFRIDADDSGLSVHIPSAVLARATTEMQAHGRDPDTPMPLHTAITGIDPLVLQGMADFAPVLRNKLEGATLLKDEATTRDGQPARRLVFRVPPGTGKADSDAIKHYRGELDVWLDASGVPLAVHEERHFKGRKFFISFSLDSSKDYALRLLGGRLVVHDYRSSQDGSGLGQRGHSETEIRLAPLDPGGDGSRHL